MCFTFRAGRASRSGRRASREREPRWQFVTSRHRSENFGRSKLFSRLQPVEFCPDNNSCQLAQLAVKLLSMNDFRLDDFEPPSFLLRFALEKRRGATPESRTRQS
jgi:hypothetical protein